MGPRDKPEDDGSYYFNARVKFVLSISNLYVSVGDKPILKGLTLDVPAGEVHAITRSNGAGWTVSCYADDRRRP